MTWRSLQLEALIITQCSIKKCYSDYGLDPHFFITQRRGLKRPPKRHDPAVLDLTSPSEQQRQSLVLILG